MKKHTKKKTRRIATLHRAARARKSVTKTKTAKAVPKVKNWRDAIDWVAAGKKAFATRMRNLGATPAATVPRAARAGQVRADAPEVSR